MTKWGILGAGNIAKRFCASLQNDQEGVLYAISGRNREKLHAFAKMYPCEKIYTDYEQLLQDPQVEAIYLALPHAYHAEWIIKAASYGKDILCEKPAVLIKQEALQVQKAVQENNVVFMEAMKNLFTPAAKEAFAQLKKLGKIQSVQLTHGYLFPREMYGKSYHTQSECGGCLWDVGCYGLGLLTPLFKQDARIHHTYANLYGTVDTYVETSMRIEETEIELICAIDRNLESKAVFQTEKGQLTLTPLHRPTRYELTMDNETITCELPYKYDDFYGEIQYFEALRHNPNCTERLMSMEDTVTAAGWSDAIRNTFSHYDTNDLKVLEEQEKTFVTNHFTAQDAYVIGQAVIALLPQYDRGVALQIIREQDQVTIFQYISDDKNASNLKYAAGKHRAVYEYGHSSAWLYVNNRIQGNPYDEHAEALPSGGSFPIKDENGTLLASIVVSGLHEGRDHELIIRALENATGKTAPVFTKAIG